MCCLLLVLGLVLVCISIVVWMLMSWCWCWLVCGVVLKVMMVGVVGVVWVLIDRLRRVLSRFRWSGEVVIGGF